MGYMWLISRLSVATLTPVFCLNAHVPNIRKPVTLCSGLPPGNCRSFQLQTILH